MNPNTIGDGYYQPWGPGGSPPMPSYNDFQDTPWGQMSQLNQNLGTAVTTPADYGAAASATPAASSAGVAGNSGAAMGAGIGAGLGLLSALGQQRAYQAKMKQLATTTRFSPWTKMSMAQPDVPNALGQITGLGASGAALGQGLGGGSMLPLVLMGGG